ncbi:MAG: ATP phosphoribosyltransferase regulatory subunit [Henriciella sp.]|nr:ATP phosphoribosyltransferase regulatory subunit [Henriciella sp.]
MSLTERAQAALASVGGDLVDPPVLIRAKVPLELSGEAVRSRICTFVDQEGREWALRPDFTLVVAQAEISARQMGASGESIRRYSGPVFRLPMTPDAPVEYDQVGLEKFGAAPDVKEDVWLFETLAAASLACDAASGMACFGDLSIFPAFVDALNLAPDQTSGLKRAFRQEGGVRAFLNGQEQVRSGLSRRLSGLDKDDIAAFVDDIFQMTNVRPVGVRSADEIVERLVERARSSVASLTTAEKSVIERVLSLDLPVAEAPEALAAIASDHKLSGLDDKLEQFKARTEALSASAHKSVMEGARFATRFGRRFTYYDGFVFEVLADAAANAPYIAGGRYDSLLRDLSAGEVDATGLGGIVIPHRIPTKMGAA